MKVCLVDADSVIPNIALMKLSSFYKAQGNAVSLVKANLSYYPNRRKKVFNMPVGYDLIFASVIFSGNKEWIHGENIIFGGTGVDLTTTLPTSVENCELDYSIYPENKTSYGFISRGCIRNCSFCFVPQKEGRIRQVANVEDIVKHKLVKFLDNNFLALPNHKEILEELAAKRIRCQFNQGLDIRLLDEDNSRLLAKLNYHGEYIFAFDNYKYLSIIAKKTRLLSWLRPFGAKFFVYVHPAMDLSNIVKRIEWLKDHKYLPYIMRDISCWSSTNHEFYVDIASYCNQVHVFKKMDFLTFLTKRHTNQNRIRQSAKLYSDAK